MTTTTVTRTLAEPYTYPGTDHVVVDGQPDTYPVYEYSRKDKYGRTVRHFEQACRGLVVMVTLPCGMGWIVNDWEATREDYSARDQHVHHYRTADGATRKEAYAQARALVAAHRPGVPIVKY
jgi:hypothetical protein